MQRHPWEDSANLGGTLAARLHDPQASLLYPLPLPEWFPTGLVPLAAGGNPAAQLAGPTPRDRQPDKGMEKGKPQAVFVFLSDT